jgi:hypothetical protein
MDQATGYTLLPRDRVAELTAALSTCRLLFESKTGVTSGGDEDKRKEKRAFLRNLLNNEDLRNHAILVDFALSDWALSVVTDYLHVVPYLNRVDLLYSLPRPTDDRIARQLFHVDPEGVTQVKFFVNVFDTDDDDGPFTFIPADESRRIIRAIRSLRTRQGKPHVGRYTDDEIDAVGGSRSIIRVTGPRGSGVAVDTSRCLHLGSRVRSALLSVVYVSAVLRVARAWKRVRHRTLPPRSDSAPGRQAQLEVGRSRRRCHPSMTGTR